MVDPDRYSSVYESGLSPDFARVFEDGEHLLAVAPHFFLFLFSFCQLVIEVFVLFFSFCCEARN